jgi:protein involved in temperature-dependent protein secretion
MFERATKLAPANLQYHWRLYDLYGNDSQMEKALAQLKLLSERLPNDRQLQQWYRGYKADYSFKRGEFFR